MSKFLSQYPVFIAICFFALYLPLCFSAMSFNFLNWEHWERFILAISIWGGTVSLLFAKTKSNVNFKV